MNVEIMTQKGRPLPILKRQKAGTRLKGYLILELLRVVFLVAAAL